MTRYSFRPRDEIFLKCYGLLYFAKTMGRNISNNLSSKYSQKLLDHGKQSAANALKTASKLEIQKTLKAVGDLTGNKIADKTIRVSKTSPKNNLVIYKGEILRERYVSSKEGQTIIYDVTSI